MKAIRYIIIALCLLAMACTPGHVKNSLARAEALMDSLPAQSLAILDSINPADLHSSSARALYALLLTQARDKNDYIITDDSIIDIALDYYSTTDNDIKKMWANFYKARVLYNNKTYPEATKYLLNSLKISKAQGNHFASGKCFDLLADIYNNRSNMPEAIANRDSAYCHYMSAGRKNFAEYCLLELSIAYAADQQGAKSLAILNDLLSEKTKNDGEQDSIFLSYIYSSLGYTYLKLKDYKQAYGAYRRHFDYLKDPQPAKQHYILLARACLNCNMPDSADYYLQKELFYHPDIANDIIYLNFRAEQAELIGDLDMMRYYYNRVINHHDSLVYVLYKNNVSLAERDFFINESETLSAKTSELKRNVITIILSFVFVIICIGVYLYLNKKRKNAEYDALIAESQNAFFQISQLESQLKDAANNLYLQKAHFNKLFKNRFKEIDTLSSIYYKRKENGENVDEVINNLKTILSSIVDEENLIELQEIINRYNNNITARFKNQFPNLKNTWSSGVVPWQG